MSPPIATLSPTIAIRPPTSAAVTMASTSSTPGTTSSKYPDVSLSSLSSSGSSTTAMSITSGSCFASFMMQQSQQPAATNTASIDFGLAVDSFPQSSLFLSTSPSAGANSAGFLCSSNLHGDDFFCLNDIAMNSSSAANTRHNSVSSNGFLDSIFHYGNTSTGGSENGYQLFSSSGPTGASLNVLIDPDLNDENYEDEGSVDTDESIVKTKSNRSEPLKKTSQDSSSETLIAIRDMAIRDKQQRKHKTSTSSASSMSRSSTIKKFAMELQNTANMAAASTSLSLNHSYHYHPYNPPANGAYQHSSFDLFVDDCVESPHEMSGEGFLDSIIDQHDFVDILGLDDWEQMLDEDRISRLTADFPVTSANQAAKMEPSNESPSLNKPLVVSLNTPSVTTTSTINPVIITKTETSSFLEKSGESKLKLPIGKPGNTSNNASRSQTPSSLTSSNSTSSSSLIDNCEFSECINPDDIFPYRRHPFRLSCSSGNGAPSLGHDASILSHDHHLTIKQQLFNSSSDDEDDDDEEEIDVVSVNSSSKPSGANSLTAFISPQPIKTPLNHNHHNYFTPISKKQNQQTTVVVANNKVKSEPMSVGEAATMVTKCSSAKKQQVTMTSTHKTSPIFSKQISNTVVSSVKKQNGSMAPKVEVIKTTKLGTATIHNTNPPQSVVINSPKSSVIAKSATTTLIKSNSSPLLPQNHQSIVTIEQQQHHQPRKTALNSSKNNPQPTTVATTKLIHNHGNGSIRILTTPSSQTATHHNSPVRSIIQHTKLVTTTSASSSSSTSPLGSTASKPSPNSLTWPTTITTTGRKMTPAATNPSLAASNKCIVNLDGDLKPLLKTEPSETTAKPLPGQNRPSTDEFESDCYDSDDDEEETDEDTDESDDDDGESSSCSSSPSTMTTASSSCSTPTKTKSKDVGSSQLAGKKKGSKGGQRAKQLLTLASTLQSSQTSSSTGASSAKRGHRLSSFVYSSDTPAEKRAFHILSERQRRNDLKKLFETLRTHIPTLSDKQKASKLTILKAAVDHLVEVTIKSNRLASTYDKEKSRNEQLLAHLKSLQSAPASNVSTSTNNSQLGFTLNYHHHRAATTTAATASAPNPTLTAVH